MATVIFSDSSNKQVQNLGWLLRNWKNVGHFVVLPTRDDAPFDCVMVASLEHLSIRGRDATTYVTSFADRRVLRDFLDRPVFRGLDVVWFGQDYIIGSHDFRSMNPKPALARA